jgi:uncharacterized protein YkwD
MKRYIILIAFMISCSLTWMRGAVWAQYQDQAALHLWGLINEARLNPLKAIERLGIDETLARDALGGNQWILDQGLTSLNRNESLFRSASDHSQDMVQHHYYSYDSLDGKKVKDRIAQTGYQASYCGESLGIVAFKTFIDPNEAADFIFLNLVRDELNPHLTGQKNIFSPSFKDLGISFEAGSMDLGDGIPFNGYLVVMDFAQPVETDTACCDDDLPTEPPKVEREDKAALYLWRMINEARDKPLAVIERLGLDEAQARLALGEDEWILDRGLQPLAVNGQLFESAWKHSEDMIENLYYNALSRDGRTVADRVAETGYEAVSTGESLAIAGFNVSLGPMAAAREVFINLINNELNPNLAGQRFIFSNDFSELGISFVAVTIDVGEGLPVSLHLAVVDFADPLALKAYLVGSLYRDVNENGFFDPGEGVKNATAIVRPYLGADEGEVVVTGSLGTYQFELPVGISEFILTDEDGRLLKRRLFFGMDENFLLDVWLN